MLFIVIYCYLLLFIVTYKLTFKYSLWSSALLLGLTLEALGPVLELVGAFCSSGMGYIVPMACYFRTE